MPAARRVPTLAAPLARRPSAANRDSHACARPDRPRRCRVAASPSIRDDVALAAIAAAAWDALAGGQPLSSHAFLRALHETGCARRDRLDAALPDRVARRRAGRRDAALRQDALVRRVRVRLGAGPTRTAARAPLLSEAGRGDPVHAGAGAAAARRRRRDARRALLAARASRRLARRRCYSSLHVLFPTDGRGRANAPRAGMLVRHGVQFHWDNPGYRDFADFLAAFNHDKRKKVKQERRRLAEAGVTFARKRRRARSPPRTGRSSTAATSDTYRAHHSTPYLTLAFFERSARRCPSTAAGPRRARRQPRLRRARRLRRATRCGAATGARPNTCPACTSRPATTRRSSSASSAASRGSKAARRACTSSRAACCR